jgi:hypothetical protein
MIGIRVKPSRKITGLRYRWGDGVVRLALYTTFPRRFLTAIWRALVIFLVAVFGPFDSMPVVGGLLIIGAYPIALIYDPGMRMKMTRDALHIGIQRYDLTAINSFRSEAVSDRKQHIHGLMFLYGTKMIKLYKSYHADDAMRIASALNNMREELLRQPANCPAANTTPAVLRSAEF